MALETLRGAVFVKEQNVPRHLEFDGLDSSALHWLALTPEDEPVGTLRKPATSRSQYLAASR